MVSNMCVGNSLGISSIIPALSARQVAARQVPAGESFTLQLRTPSTASKPSKLQKPPTGTTSPSRFAAVQGEALYNHAPDPTDCVLRRKDCAYCGRPLYGDCMVGSTKSFGDCESVLINSVLAVRVDCTCPLSYL